MTPRTALVAVTCAVGLLSSSCSPRECGGEERLREGSWIDPFPDPWPSEEYGRVTGELVGSVMTFSYTYGASSAWEMAIELEQPLPCVVKESTEKHVPDKCVVGYGFLELGQARRTLGNEGDPAEQQELWAEFTRARGCDGLLQLWTAEDGAAISFTHSDGVGGTVARNRRDPRRLPDPLARPPFSRCGTSAGHGDRSLSTT